jgi:catechol 2,3-dioxygenase-like lactoylglutathione lyase family enzyme
MDIRFQSTVLITKQFDEMKQFYTGLLGQRARFDFGNCLTFECDLTIWQPREEHVISRALGTKNQDSGNDGLEVCFETDDFENEAERVKAGGVALLHDVAEETWGQRTMRFYDPDGNIVELGESMPYFCLRLHKEGMSAAEVAQKTGIQMETVLTYLNRDARG